ncbi:MAG: GTPase ObgE, partial [Sphingomonas sp.]|nr:GTPase ObgE [Sphingomonas sp.]
GLQAKAEVVALSRSDIVEAGQLAEAKAAVVEAGAADPFVISAATGQGMPELLDAIIEHLAPVEKAAAPEEIEKDWSPL